MSMPHELIVNGTRYVRDGLPEADGISAYLMYDCHLFRPCKGKTVRQLANDWQKEHDKPDKKYGPPMLCPIIVMAGKKELRRVGEMVHECYDFSSREQWDKQKKGLKEWIAVCEADPDISRLLTVANRGTEP